MTREVVGFAGQAVCVDSEGETAERVAHLLLRRLARAAEAESTTTIALRMQGASDAGTLAVGGVTRMQVFEAGALAEHTQAALAYELIMPCRSGLLVHAGAVGREGRAVLLPADSGSGKSTLTAWLTARGFVHHTDELVHLPLSGDGPLEGYRRPIELKTGGRALIEPLIERPKTDAAWLDTGDGCMIDPELLGPGRTEAHGEPRALIFPRYAGPSAPFELRRLSAAEASFSLVRCLLNAPNLPGHGLPATAAWARRLPAYALSYGNFAGVDEAIADCLARAEG